MYFYIIKKKTVHINEVKRERRKKEKEISNTVVLLKQLPMPGGSAVGTTDHKRASCAGFMNIKQIQSEQKALQPGLPRIEH